MAEIIKRSFNISDAKLYTSALHFLELYKTDHAQFEESFPKLFTSDYAQQFEQTIEQMIEFSDDSFVCVDQKHATIDLVTVQNQFLRLYRKLRIYIEDAFAGDSDRLRQMGVGSLTKKKQSRDELFRFASLLTHLVREYEDQLVEAGCSLSLLDTLDSTVVQLYALRDQQAVEKVVRENKKIGRITTSNRLWACMVQMRRVAPFVFENDPFHASLYDLPKQRKPRTSRKKDEQEPIEPVQGQ